MYRYCKKNCCHCIIWIVLLWWWNTNFSAVSKKVRETWTGRNPENFGECFVSHSNGSSLILRRHQYSTHHHYHQGWNRTASLDQITCITSEKKKLRVWYGICATQHYFRKSWPTVIWSFGGQKLCFRFDILLTKTWPKT